MGLTGRWPHTAARSTQRVIRHPLARPPGNITACWTSCQVGRRHLTAALQRPLYAAHVRGRVIAESLRVGAIVTLEHVELTSVGRHDVTAGTRPDGAVRAEDGAVAGQPSVWTFVDFAASGHTYASPVRGGLVAARASARLGVVEGVPTLARRRHRNRRPGCAARNRQGGHQGCSEMMGG